jgi:hypothetical protein
MTGYPRPFGLECTTSERLPPDCTKPSRPADRTCHRTLGIPSFGTLGAGRRGGGAVGVLGTRRRRVIVGEGHDRLCVGIDSGLQALDCLHKGRHSSF